MELVELIMDTGGAEALNGTMWFPNTPSPPLYRRLSPVTQNGCELVTPAQQTTMGYQSPENSLWQERQNTPKGSPETDTRICSDDESPRHLSPPSSNHNSNCQHNSLKRRPGESLHHIAEFEKKHVKRDGSIGSNGSGQGWSTQVEELAEHLAADFDGSLSALAASDLATAVASYNMSEALLALPSLTVFKQEAPSTENQQTNSNLNHVSQRTINSAPPSNGNNGGGGHVDSAGSVEADCNNNGGQQTATANLHQLLYSSSSGNHVSSSQHGNELNEDCRFQYVLAAATSIATKLNEETLTYLNQGQSYEIKLKKLGDLSAYRGKILKGHTTFLFQSTIRICFHERRLQYTEREQMLAWQRARPGERLLEVDVPLSYGMVDVSQPSPSNNSVEFMWDPTKEVGVYIKVNCISTEFTPKKHGGEKGVPFRIQVETRLPGGARLHAASCQVKVFKLKGADRKHKQDRDKILRRPPHEQDKYQPSYDCTVLSDIPLDSLSSSSLIAQTGTAPYASTEAVSPQARSTINESSSPLVALSASNPGSIVSLIPPSDAVKENVGTTAAALPSPAAVLPDQSCIGTEGNQSLGQLAVGATAAETNEWLRAARFNAFESTFASFAASDILRLSRDDLIQICGLADGIRLFNALHSKPPTPKLTLYFSLEGNGSLWRVAYLNNLTSSALISKLLGTFSLPHDRLHSILFLGPQGIHVLVTDELVANMKDEGMYFVETIKDIASDRYKLLLKPSLRS